MEDINFKDLYLEVVKYFLRIDNKKNNYSLKLTIRNNKNEDEDDEDLRELKFRKGKEVIEIYKKESKDEKENIKIKLEKLANIVELIIIDLLIENCFKKDIEIPFDIFFSENSHQFLFRYRDQVYWIETILGGKRC